MSKILEKVFDASKKIIRSIFKGSPNLLTSADLNRQFEAVKYQLDQLDDKTGMVSDITFLPILASGTLSVGYNLTYLKFKGCAFSPEVKPFAINFTSSAPMAYFCLVADTEIVTYEDDATHEVAGAKFEDGTSMPAANQVVYKNERFVLTHALSSVENLVGVIAVFTLSDAGNVIVKSNTIKEKDSITMHVDETISDFNPSLTGKVQNGKSYDEAFSIIENRFSNVVSDWDYLTESKGSAEKDTDIAFRIQSGLLYLNIPEKKIPYPSDEVDLFQGTYVLKIGDFPSDKKQAILDLFKRLDFKSFGKLMEGGFVPYGEFGCFPIYSKYFESTPAGGELTKYYPVYGTGKVSVILQYENTENGQTLNDVYIGVYLASAIMLAEDIKDFQFASPANWLCLINGDVYVPRLISAVPLFGPS